MVLLLFKNFFYKSQVKLLSKLKKDNTHNSAQYKINISPFKDLEQVYLNQNKSKNQYSMVWYGILPARGFDGSPEVEPPGLEGSVKRLWLTWVPGCEGSKLEQPPQVLQPSESTVWHICGHDNK